MMKQTVNPTIVAGVSFSQGFVWGVLKGADPRADQLEGGICLHKLPLCLQALRLQHIVGVHSGNPLPFTGNESPLQGLHKSHPAGTQQYQATRRRPNVRKNLQSVVGGAIVHHHQLKALKGLPLEALKSLPQGRRRVVDGHQH